MKAKNQIDPTFSLTQYQQFNEQQEALRPSTCSNSSRPKARGLQFVTSKQSPNFNIRLLSNKSLIKPKLLIINSQLFKELIKNIVKKLYSHKGFILQMSNHQMQLFLKQSLKTYIKIKLIVLYKVKHIKESLYFQLIQYKKEGNSLRNETIQLKSQVQMLTVNKNKLQFIVQKEHQKLEKMYLDLNSNEKAGYFNQHASSNQIISENTQASTYKNELKIAYNRLRQKDQKLQEALKSMKYTQIQELQIQVDKYEEEIKRLLLILKEYQSPQVAQNNEEMKEIMLKSENIEMNARLQLIEIQNKKYQDNEKQQEKTIQKLQIEIKLLKNDLNKKTKIIKNIENMDYGWLQAQQSKQNQSTQQQEQEKQIEAVKIQLEDKIKELKNKEETINYKDQKLFEQEAKLKELIKENQANQDRFLIEKQNLEMKIHQLNKEIKQYLQEQQNTKLKLVLETASNDLIQNEDTENQEKEALNPLISKLKQPKVNQYELGELPSYIKCILQLNHIEPNQINAVFYLMYQQMVDRCFLLKKFKRKERQPLSYIFQTKQLLFYRQLIEVLKDQPFEITDENQVIKFSRYLVEENNEDYVKFSLHAKQDINVVNTIFKKLIGKYNVLTQEQEIKAYLEIGEVTQLIIEAFTKMLKKYKDNFKESIKQHTQKNTPNMKNDFTTKDVLEETLVFLDAKITDQAKEFLYLQLFSVTKKQNMIKISSIYNLFEKKYYQILQEEKDKQVQKQLKEEIKIETFIQLEIQLLISNYREPQQNQFEESQNIQSQNIIAHQEDQQEIKLEQQEQIEPELNAHQENQQERKLQQIEQTQLNSQKSDQNQGEVFKNQIEQKLRKQLIYLMINTNSIQKEQIAEEKDKTGEQQ